MFAQSVAFCSVHARARVQAMLELGQLTHEAPEPKLGWEYDKDLLLVGHGRYLNVAREQVRS